MPKFRKKPIIIEAVQFTGTSESIDQIDQLMGIINDIDLTGGKARIAIETKEGIMTAQIGDYVIKGIAGEFYPCKPDIFEKTYEAVD